MANKKPCECSTPDRTTDLADGSTYCHACGGHVSDAVPEKALILNKTSAQRVYVRRSIAHVCVRGRTYGRLLQCTAISSAMQATVSLSSADENKAIVSQTLPMGTVAEAWTLIEF